MSDLEEIKNFLAKKGLEEYIGYIIEGLRQDRYIGDLIHEVYQLAEVKALKELKIKPKKTLPKDLILPNARIEVTKEPTPGETIINASEKLKLGQTCHPGYKGKQEGNKISCELEEQNLDYRDE